MEVAKTILIVEDQQNFRKIYADRLAREGYSVIEAANGVLGLAELARNKVDLVLLDIIMPEKNGDEVLAEMRNDPLYKDIPVVVLSVFDQHAHVEQMMNLGANAYLVKGMNTPNEVVKKINGLLGKDA